MIANAVTDIGELSQPEEEQPRGVGSGFILSADGYVMTNAHVVDGAEEVLVTLPDKREFKAKIVGTDKRTDVAVVKIRATGLPAVKIGDANRLKVGERVRCRLDLAFVGHLDSALDRQAAPIA